MNPEKVQDLEMIFGVQNFQMLDRKKGSLPQQHEKVQCKCQKPEDDARSMGIIRYIGNLV